MTAANHLAAAFIQSLPDDIIPGTIGIDADGRILFEWEGPGRDGLTVTMADGGTMAYSGRVNGVRVGGSMSQFTGKVWPIMLEHLQVICGAE